MTVLILITAVSLILFCGVKTAKPLNTAIKTVPALACAVYAFSHGDSTLIAAGLCVCALADAVLNYVFVPGTVLFGLAHLCFMAGFISRGGHWTLRAIVFILLASLLVYTVLNAGNRKKQPLMLVYVLLLSLMTALACGCGASLMLGGILFTVSDTVLGMRILYGWRPRYAGWLCMGTYYAALVFMALGA